MSLPLIIHFLISYAALFFFLYISTHRPLFSCHHPVGISVLTILYILLPTFLHMSSLQLQTNPPIALPTFSPFYFFYHTDPSRSLLFYINNNYYRNALHPLSIQFFNISRHDFFFLQTSIL